MAADSERYDVFTIIDNKDPNKKGFFVKIGTAWKNKDGSMNTKLDAFPVNGTTHTRLHVPKEDREGFGD
jgi:hypothetical protein